jgi:hypothetical protein
MGCSGGHSRLTQAQTQAVMLFRQSGVGRPARLLEPGPGLGSRAYTCNNSGQSPRYRQMADEGKDVLLEKIDCV